MDELVISGSPKVISDIKVAFLKRKDPVARELVATIFDYYEVPSGIDYEYDLPKNLQYWNQQMEEDYENEYITYAKYPINFEKFVSKIKNIEAKIKLSNDELTKKSLILSSCIISESLLKSAIVSGIPEEKGLVIFEKRI